MHYPEEFKAKVKELYPHCDNFVRMMEDGDERLGEYLRSTSDQFISIDDVLAATSIQELHERARTQKDRIRLSCEWGKLYNEQESSRQRRSTYV